MKKRNTRDLPEAQAVSGPGPYSRNVDAVAYNGGAMLQAPSPYGGQEHMVNMPVGDSGRPVKLKRAQPAGPRGAAGRRPPSGGSSARSARQTGSLTELGSQGQRRKARRRGESSDSDSDSDDSSDSDGSDDSSDDSDDDRYAFFPLDHTEQPCTMHGLHSFFCFFESRVSSLIACCVCCGGACVALQ
eukprot:COSAG05_NODE_2011_length_3702_cov_3.111019_2_plen_187_part_00